MFIVTEVADGTMTAAQLRDYEKWLNKTLEEGSYVYGLGRHSSDLLIRARILARRYRQDACDKEGVK